MQDETSDIDSKTFKGSFGSTNRAKQIIKAVLVGIDCPPNLRLGIRHDFITHQIGYEILV